MRIPSGVTDQYVYFIALDATDLKTRETGLSSFTVYRSRNGGAAAAMTTPTINETDVTNMPGVYELLLDEDMTIDSGDDSQEMLFHITHSGMAPTDRVIELYRPKITAGNTLTVESDGDLTKVNTLDGHTPQTGDNFARLGAPAGASVSADVAAVKAQTGAIETDTQAIEATLGTPAGASLSADIAVIESQTDDIGTAGAGLTALGDARIGNLDATVSSRATPAQVNTEVDAALSDVRLDELLAADSDIDGAAPPTVGSVFHELLTKTAGSFTYDQSTDSLEAIRDRGDAAWVTGAAAPTAASIADAVWEEAIADHSGTAGSTAEALAAAGSAGDPWTTALPGAYGAGTAGKIVGDNLNATVSSRASQASVDTVDDFLDTEITDIRNRLPAALVSGRMDSSVGAMAADTLTAAALAADAVTEIQSGLSTLTAAGVRSAVGLASANLDTQLDALPTAAENADAVWDEARADHTTAGSFGQGAASVQGNVTGSVASVTAGVTLAASAVQAIWDALTSALTTVGSIGKLLVDRIDAAISSRLASASYTAPDNTSITAIKAKTDNLPADPADASDIAASFTTVNTKLDTIDDLIDTEVTAIKAKTDLIPASPAAVGSAMTLTSGERDALATAHLDLADGVETGLTVRENHRVAFAACGGKLSGAATTTVNIRNKADTKNRIAATVDADGNRSAVTLDLT